MKYTFVANIRSALSMIVELFVHVCITQATSGQ